MVKPGFIFGFNDKTNFYVKTPRCENIIIQTSHLIFISIRITLNIFIILISFFIVVTLDVFKHSIALR